MQRTTTLRLGGRFITLAIAFMLATMLFVFTGSADARVKGKRVSVAGTLLVAQADDMKHKKAVNDYQLKLSNGTYLRVRISRKARIFGLRGMRRGVRARGRLDRLANARLRITGLRTRGQIKAQRIVVLKASVGAKKSQKTTGDIKVAVVLFNFSNNQGRPAEVAQVENDYFDSPTSVQAFYAENSASNPAAQVNLTGDVFDYVTLTDDDVGCTAHAWGDEAIALATAQRGLNVSEYDYVSFVFPRPLNPEPSYSACATSVAGFAGLGANRNWNMLPIPRVFAHELGHNFGLRHANSFECEINEVQTAMTMPSGRGDCSANEYGDVWDVMGNAYRQTSAVNKRYLDHLPASSVLETSSFGEFTIAPSEHYAPSATQLLMIPRNGGNVTFGENYALDYRQPYGAIDAVLSGDQAIAGVSIRLAHDALVGIAPGESHLVDPAPADGEKSTLAPGHTLVDPYNGVRFETLTATPSGATVRYSPELPLANRPEVYVQAGVVRYTASAGVYNTVTAYSDTDSVTIIDSATSLRAGSGCTQIKTNEIECSRVGLTGMKIELGDLDDSFEAESTFALPIEIHGQDGNDILHGGGANDLLDGATGADQMRGGPGNDTVDYSARTAPVTARISEGGLSNLNGEFNENDGVGDDVERLLGGSAADVLTGASRGETLIGNGGDDVLDGGTGADTLEGGTGIDTVTYQTRTTGVSVVPGDSFTDGAPSEGDQVLGDIENVIGGSGNDTIAGTAGANLIVGNGGNDTLIGLSGADDLQGGDGNDIVDALDSETDSVDCGNDTDSVVADASDAVMGNCESTSANAGSASVVGAQIRILAGSGVNNDVTVTRSGTQFTIVDVQPITNGPGCTALTTTSVRCTASTSTKLVVSLGDGNDVWRPSTNSATVDGGDGDDTLTGGSGADTITGGAGNDTLSGGSGIDTFIADAGADEINGGSGNDHADYSARTVALGLSADGQNDDGAAGEGDRIASDVEKLTGGVGDDTLVGSSAVAALLYGGGGADSLNASNADAVNMLYGGDGDDVIIGSPGVDVIYGGAGGDECHGGDGGDTFFGGTDDDALYGGAGDDEFLVRDDFGNDYYNGDLGDDLIDYGQRTENLTVSLDGYSGSGEVDEWDTVEKDIERVKTGSGDDTINAADSYVATRLDAGAGNDTVTGSYKSDTIIAGPGDDTFNGVGAVDTLDYSSETAAVNVDLSVTAAQNTGGSGNDTILAIENLVGSSHNDTLVGSTAANKITGGLGNDTLNGGTGTDTLDYSNATAGVTVSLANTAAQNTIGAGTDTVLDFENLTGSYYDDDLTGGATANVLAGWYGNDTVRGGPTDLVTDKDTIDLSASPSAVAVDLSGSAPQVTGGLGSDTLQYVENVTASAYDDTIRGNSSDNVLSTGNGNDVVRDATGNDTLTGGSGTDWLDYRDAPAGVTVRLTTTTAQATGGAGSDTVTQFENLRGSSYNDVLTGNYSANVIAGGLGNDVITGYTTYASTDIDTLDYSSASGGITINLNSLNPQNTGSDGTDTVKYMENVIGTPFNDVITGNGFANTIEPGVGVDTVSTAAGNDVIKIRDGANDNTTICGTGTDTVHADLTAVGDPVAADCETVNRQ